MSLGHTRNRRPRPPLRGSAGALPIRCELLLVATLEDAGELVGQFECPLIRQLQRQMGTIGSTVLRLHCGPECPRLPARAGHVEHSALGLPWADLRCPSRDRTRSYHSDRSRLISYQVGDPITWPQTVAAVNGKPQVGTTHKRVCLTRRGSLVVHLLRSGRLTCDVRAFRRDRVT